MPGPIASASNSRFLAALTLVVLVASRAIVGAADAPVSDTEQVFRNPGRAAEPWCYWIWINGNVTKEGIRADLEDMRRVGIGGAMLFDGSLYLPRGPVRYGSDSWHEHMQYMLKTAAELDIKITLMNCAGWATSGGPWNDVGHSMKMYVWSEQAANIRAGEREWRAKLPRPQSRLGYYRDVAVLAVPQADEPAPSVTTEKSGATRFDFSEPVTMRRLEIDMVRDEHEESVEGVGSDTDLMPGGKIEASFDGKTFRVVKKFTQTRQEFGSRVELGFEPVMARSFRVTLQPRARSSEPWKFAAMQFSNTPRLKNLAEKTGLKTQQPPEPSEWAASAPGEFAAKDVIDLTPCLASDGTLAWENPPAGRWAILRFGYTTSARKNHPSPPEGEGLEVDKFDGEAVANHFEHALGRVIREASRTEAKRALAGVLCDSWEAGAQTWTRKLPEIFAARRGYDMTRFLPALMGRIVDTQERTEAFLADFRRTLGELYASEYYGTMQRKSHENGMQFFAEAYGGVLDEPRALGHIDVPMVEFWTFGLFKGFDYAPSTAHLMGTRVIGAEAFTGRPPRARWGETPRSLKTLGDAAYAAGINSFVLHSYVHQPRAGYAPGFTHGRYGTHFGRLNSWWPFADSWIDYLQRCQFLLQHGRPVADILCLQDERLKTEQRELLKPALAGYQSDLISVSQLGWLSVDADGTLRTKAGARYRVLQLPKTWIASLETLRELARLKNAGARIAGQQPFASATLTDSPQMWAAAQEAVFGKGKSIFSLGKTLAGRLKPDFEQNSGADVRFFHRAADDGDYYFVTNQSGRALAMDATFRIGDRIPELWDPVSGKISDAQAWRIEDGRAIVALTLGETDSVFVVFRRPLGERSAAPVAAKTSPATTLEVRGPWAVSFAPATGRAVPAITIDKLAPLEKHADSDIRYFSGLATYETTFEFPSPRKGRRVCINLGEVYDLARITLNGKIVATLWKPPFAADVTGFVRAGKNDLKITVANRWVNRLIGDEQLPSDLEYGRGKNGTVDALLKFPAWWDDPEAFRKRERQAFSTWKHYKADSPLVPSGLAGPVAIEIREGDAKPEP